ncbi:MAG: dolichyl-phosphate beta-glucosyltransferase [Verrucomicrobiota bacterium]
MNGYTSGPNQTQGSQTVKPDRTRREGGPPTRRSLSLLIPAFNEAERISGTLKRTAAFLRKENYDWEIIVIDDGSSDDTSAIVKTIAKSEGLTGHLKVVRLPQNQGKGAAVKAGILVSKHQFCLICDADLAVPIEDIQRLWPSVDLDATAIVIGSRKLLGEETVIKSRWYRKILGRVFNALIARLAPDIYDTQCGFKLIPSDRAKGLARRQVELGFAFDVEYLHLALRSGWPVHEVGVNWRHIDGSKVRIVRDSIRMFRSIIRIWFRSKIGAYGAFPINTAFHPEA